MPRIHCETFDFGVVVVAAAAQIELLFCYGPHAVEKTQCVTNEIKFLFLHILSTASAKRIDFRFYFKLFHRIMQSI